MFKSSILFKYIRQLIFRYKDDDLPSLSAQITYYLILAFFPFLLFLINFFVSLVCVFALSVIILPIILALIIFNLAIPLYILVIVTFLLIVTIAAALMSFQTSAWTILFLELKGDVKSNTVKAKLERIFSKKTKTTRKTKK